MKCISNKINSIIFLTIAYCFINTDACDKTVYIKNSNIDQPINNRELIIVLEGFGSNSLKRKTIASFISNTKYDLLIPDYIGRTSVNECAENFKQIIESHNIHEYKKVHIFCYILGTWTLNQYLQNNTIDNLSSIIYDRSPLQERAPYLVTQNMGMLIKIIVGKVVKDLANISYQPVHNDNLAIGIIIENRATPYVRRHKKQTLQMGALSWSVDSLNQRYDDFYHTPLHHYQMYSKFDSIGDEVCYFFSHGKFPKNTKKSKYEGDSFSKWNKEYE